LKSLIYQNVLLFGQDQQDEQDCCLPAGSRTGNKSSPATSDHACIGFTFSEADENDPVNPVKMFFTRTPESSNPGTLPFNIPVKISFVATKYVDVASDFDKKF
jgi:hypothetical protein